MRGSAGTEREEKDGGGGEGAREGKEMGGKGREGRKADSAVRTGSSQEEEREIYTHKCKVAF